MSYIMNKGGKQYTVNSEIAKNKLLNEGYDEIELKDNELIIVTPSPKKTFSAVEYNKLVEEIKVLNLKIDEQSKKIKVLTDKK